MGESSFYGSFLKENELLGIPLCVPLIGDFNLTMVVLSIEKYVSTLDNSTIAQVINPKVKSTNAKYFAQVLSMKSSIIPHYQLMMSSLKGDDIPIKILEDEYIISLEPCKNDLHGRLILSKGDIPLKLQDLRDKLNTL